MTILSDDEREEIDQQTYEIQGKLAKDRLERMFQSMEQMGKKREECGVFYDARFDSIILKHPHTQRS